MFRAIKVMSIPPLAPLATTVICRRVTISSAIPKPTYHKIHQNFGVRVEGVDLTRWTPEFLKEEVSQALEKYGLLYFPRQFGVSPEMQFELSRSMPDVDLSVSERNPFAPDEPCCQKELPSVRFLGSSHGTSEYRKDIIPETYLGGGDWHSDGCGITTMVCDEGPDGSDPNVKQRETLFSCGYNAYECLTWDLKLKAVTLNCHIGCKHTMDASIGEMYKKGLRMKDNGLRLLSEIDSSRLTKEELHARANTQTPMRWDDHSGPMVKRNPWTMKHTVLTWPMSLECIEGLEPEESRDLMEQILTPGCTGDAVYAHPWTPGDLVIWDGRSTMHSSTKIIPQPQLVRQCYLRTRTKMLPPDVKAHEEMFKQMCL